MFTMSKKHGHAVTGRQRVAELPESGVFRLMLDAHRFDRRGKPVADASLRNDQPRVRGIAFYLLAEAADLHIDRAFEDLGVVDARKIEQLLPTQDPLGRDQECDKQVVFANRQSD